MVQNCILFIYFLNILMQIIYVYMTKIVCKKCFLNEVGIRKSCYWNCCPSPFFGPCTTDQATPDQLTILLNNLLYLYEYFCKKVHVKKQTGGVFCYLINDLLLTALLNLQKKANSALVSKSQFPPTKKSRGGGIGKPCPVSHRAYLNLKAKQE